MMRAPPSGSFAGQLHATTGEVREVELGGSPSIPLKLERGKLLEPAEWSRLRELAHQLFGLERPAPQRSLQSQDKFAAALRDAGQKRRTVLQALHTRLVELGIQEGKRLTELHDANLRLAPLAKGSTESHKIVSEFLLQWPNDGSDPLRAVVRKAEAIRDALVALDEHARNHLEAARSLGGSDQGATSHLKVIWQLLWQDEATQPLTSKSIEDWNKEARKIVQKLLDQMRDEQERMRLEQERLRIEQEKLKEQERLRIEQEKVKEQERLRIEQEQQREQERLRREQEEMEEQERLRRQRREREQEVESREQVFSLDEVYDPSRPESLEKLLQQIRARLTGLSGPKLKVVLHVQQERES